MVSKNSKILVVGGAGTMGSSTALHLARRGYTDIRVLDMFQPPSGNSAGNDMNKLISTQYVDGIWGRLALETWSEWNADPLFKPFLHTVGRLDLAQHDEDRVSQLKKQLEATKAIGREDNMEWLSNKQDILKKAPFLCEADIEGWKGLWIRDSGWVAARDALTAVGAELRKLGVKSAFGTAGTFKSLILGEDGRTCLGVRAVDGTEWYADTVIMATGAWSPTLIDLEDQCISKCWQFGHIQLTPEEVESLRDTPTTYNMELGFFMEPSPQGVMKFVNEFEGYTRMATCRPFGSDKDIKISVPRSHALHPTDTIPEDGVKGIKKVIKTCFPNFAHKPLFDTAICWCTDSYDGNWLLCEDPRYNGLILATGDCGHTFKMLPIVGKYVCDLLENKLSDEDKNRWRWRPEGKKPNDTGREGGQPQDLADQKGWCHDDEIQSDSTITALAGRMNGHSI
ncbi:uncharacterized protein L201_003761 [Kwoniella dendrophila CBS 6074]|uniref:FAD dependent oxidoreductase domain-containing protein n=1 Tax=Kwoniella dendrophila CBS 6074 TaxID=1295534 RepID=A0AAX4JTW0_9TREE